MQRKRVAILISGRGSNMASLIAAAKAPDYPAEIVLVVSNKPGAGGLAIAEAAGIATRTIPHKSFPDRASFEEAMERDLIAAGTELICLAGFMRVLTDGFIERWRNRPRLHRPFRALGRRQRPDHRPGFGAGSARRHSRNSRRARARRRA
jgi:phosphoribosylglycinamide formyltransferase-1